MSRLRPTRTLAAAALVVAALAALYVRLLERSEPSRPATAAHSPEAGASTSPSDAYAPAPAVVAAHRAGECDRALAAIETPTEEARVVAGLYAHECGAHAAALERLRESAGYTGPLADWRLWALGKTATELGQPQTAQSALARLALEIPDSPLAGLALATAAEIALERQDLGAADRLVATGRTAQLAAPEGARIERVAWRAATARGDEAARRDTARRLLTAHPLIAADLGVVDLFRHPDGSIEWARILTDTDLAGRARRLLDADLAGAAVETLEEVAPAARDEEWTLVYAEALTGARRGVDALRLLDGRTASTLELETRLEWRRARAALEASVARRGRTLRAAERAAHRQAAHRHLRRVVALGGDTGLRGRALRLLFAELADDGRFEDALEILRALRELDPSDETGAGFLWRRGWRELERRNHSSAIGYWTELRQLYPDSTAARRALYWSARAHQELGNQGRSQDLLRSVVASPGADFYHRHAMEWLTAPPPPVTAGGPRQAWPLDPALARARRLSDLGLDELALAEIGRIAERADPPAVHALKALVLARQGKHRQSIVELRRAFPDLGTHRQHRAPRAALELYYPRGFGGLVTDAAERNELSPHLVFAMIRQESAFDSGAHSHAGARGLMQVMPATGRELAGRLGLPYDRGRLVDPGFSVELGTAYYRQVLRSFGDEELALAGYNGGPNRIRRWWNDSGEWSEIDRFIESLPLEETRTYVQRIVLLSNSYRDLDAG